MTEVIWDQWPPAAPAVTIVSSYLCRSVSKRPLIHCEGQYTNSQLKNRPVSRPVSYSLQCSIEALLSPVPIYALNTNMAHCPTS